MKYFCQGMLIFLLILVVLSDVLVWTPLHRCTNVGRAAKINYNSFLRALDQVRSILSDRWLGMILFTNPSARAGYDTRSIFKRSLTSLNSEFSFSLTSCLTKVVEPSLSYYLPIVGGRIIGFIPFPRVLVLCEMQSAWSRIWTRVALSISNDDNHYTTDTSFFPLRLSRIWHKVNF